MSALSDLLNSKPVSARQAADKAKDLGIPLSYGTIAAYWSGGHGRPTAKTLEKLAKVVPFTEKKLQEAAWHAAAPLGKWIPPEESILLDRQTRKALDNLIKAVVARVSSNDMETEASSGASTQGRQAQEVSASPLVDQSEIDPPPNAGWATGPDEPPGVSGDQDGQHGHQFGGG